jgi:alpha-L-fucosidase
MLISKYSISLRKSISAFITAGILTNGVYAQKIKPYEENWESINKHQEAPEWFNDAKFGIYFHWGVYSVPGFSTWYPRNMFIPGMAEYNFHKEKYGDPAKFGYHDLVPLFKAENFNAQEWAQLFKDAGAQFAGPVAEHHDGFAMWDSKLTPWNAKDMGPKKDITGELEKAIRKLDMKFITTFHHERQLQRYADKPNEEFSNKKNYEKFWESHFPFFKGMPTTSTDPKLRLLYGNIPEKEWLENQWFGKIKEVVDKYNPDILWFDGWLHMIPEAYRLKMAAYYLNHAKKKNKEVVIVRKQRDLPLEMSVDDLEKSRKNRLEAKTWMTDETIGIKDWSYTSNLQIKSLPDILHILIDVVSKNGVLLLNIAPTPSGDIPENQREVLLGVGKWLKTNGEAIYNTRPWYTYGEGPTKEPEGHFENREAFLKVKYSAKDVRYTTKTGVIYATLLGELGAGQEVILKSFAKDQLPKIERVRNVSFIGSDEKIKWSQTEKGLVIQAPAEAIKGLATTIKIQVQAMDEPYNIMKEPNKTAKENEG